MRRMTGALLAGAMTFGIAHGANAKTYYWISHGSPADPVWTYFLAGAEQWATDTGNTVNTSFHNGDVASHQEAVRAAIAAGADGIVDHLAPTRAASSRSPTRRTRPTSRSSTSTPPTRPRASTPMSAATTSSSAATGRSTWSTTAWSKQGDFVWMPVEVPGATYGVQEEEGIKSVFEPLGITWEVTDATLDQAEIITRMSDYLTANRDKIKAIIGLGDLVTGSIKRVFDQVGVAPGDIPVVGWGNSLDTTQEVLNGYVNAAQWQDPQATSYVALSLAAMAASGIPAGFDVITGALYEKDAGAALRRHPVGQVSPAGAGGRRARAAPAKAIPWTTARLCSASSPCPSSGRWCCSSSSSRVFTAINPTFLSPLNIRNTLAFTVELGLIALAMTLLMTSGEFDLSVGSVFGFAPVLMWTLFNAGVDVAARSPSWSPCSSPWLIGLVNGLFVTRLKIPSFLVTLGMLLVVRGTALFITDGFPQRTWNAEGRLARRGAGRRLLRRPVPHLHVAVLVHRRRAGPRLRADPHQGRQLDPGLRRQRPAPRGPAASRSSRTKVALFMLSAAMAALRRHHQLDPHLGRQPEQRHRLRARGHRHGGDRRHAR